METSISSNGRKVVSSGSFSTFNEEASVISLIRGSEGFDISVTLKEDNSSNQASMKIESKKDEKKNLVNIDLVLFNFKGPFSSGFVEPVNIGFFDNKDKIYLQINARNLGANTKRYEINYTIYLEEAN